MTSRTRSIAMLATNQAYASIFCSAFEAEAGISVPVFSSLSALSTFIRISPVDIAVLNVDAPWDELVRIVHSLKHMPRAANPLLEVILLTGAVPVTGLEATSGAAAILAKPVTPAKLIETIDRVSLGKAAREERRHIRPARPRPSVQVAPRERVGNVIPLFSNRSQL